MFDLHVSFKKLWHHPLLVSSTERFYFPIDATTELGYIHSREGNYDDMRNVGQVKYDHINFVLGCKKIKFHDNIKKEEGFANVLSRGTYPENIGCAIQLSRNIIVHINQNIYGNRVMEKNDVVKKLCGFIPELLTSIYWYFLQSDYDLGFLYKRSGRREEDKAKGEEVDSVQVH